ncbi:MAG TPA: hypothetical protein VG126_13000, partial [Thermoleophilaceae bacterium]|nr:hypothetical protein [Thermoleophilaceae bacterium]
MEGRREEDDRPLEPRDWEQTRGEQQQESRDPHEQPTAVEREQAYHDEPGGPGAPEEMRDERGGAARDERGGAGGEESGGEGTERGGDAGRGGNGSER